MKKRAIIIATLLAFCQNSFANQIDKLIKNSDFDSKTDISILVQNKENGSILYKKNEEKLLNPASTLKTLTFGAAYITLGQDFQLETALYKDSNNNLYLKLSGDTLLSQNNLNKLFADLKKEMDTSKINNIFIDDSIFDKVPYPNDWQEEDIWPKTRMITPYIIDNNTTKIAINRSSLATKVDIIQDDDYKLPIINELEISDKHDIKIARLYGENSSIINLQGSVSKDDVIELPVLKPEINFHIKLQNALEKNNIIFDKKFNVSKTPNNAVKVALFSRPIEEFSRKILLESDNFTSEVIFKVGAAKYINYQRSATLDDAIDMFYQIYSKYITPEIKITDGSGVSKTNLINLKFYNNALNHLFKNTKIVNLMASANQGTLKERLSFLENNLKAKTGTLSCQSSLSGTLQTRKNQDVIFSVIVQNSSKRKALLKHFENRLIGTIYKNY